MPLPGFVAITAFGLVLAWVTVRTGGLEPAVEPLTAPAEVPAALDDLPV